MKSVWFKICFAIFVLGAIGLRWLDDPGPNVIAFEFAKTIDNANTMVAIWDNAQALHLKRLSLFLDYIFIIGYAGSLFFILQEWWLKSDKKWVYYLSLLPIVAGILDAIENLGLLQIVYHQGTQFSASLAYYCAGAKFLLLLPAIFVAVYYLAIKFFKKV